jgi:fructokinase
MSRVIAVIGEALVDLVGDGSGEMFSARPGGGPYNTACALARLGASVVFAGRLSSDQFGQLLRDRLEADGVGLGIPEASGLPTTLAVANLDDGRSARYSFYLEGTAAADVAYGDLLGAVSGATAVAVNGGALGFVLDPIASGIERLVVSGLSDDVLLMVDPNCRPGTVRDRDAYAARLRRVFRRADIVKASVEDLAYLFPGVSPDKAAVALLEQGTALVLITDGGRPARGYLPHAAEISVPVPVVDIVDTIGAGDAFGGGFLARWTAGGHSRAELRPAGPRLAETVRDAIEYAARVAALTCTRPGADPPAAADLA